MAKKKFALRASTKALQYSIILNENTNSYQNGPKFKIVLHKRYVAQNLQNCVRILTIFSESKLKQKLGVLRDKNEFAFSRFLNDWHDFCIFGW